MKSARFLSFLYTALHFHFLFLLPSLSQRETFDAAHNAKLQCIWDPLSDCNCICTSPVRSMIIIIVAYCTRSCTSSRSSRSSRLKSKHKNEEIFPLYFFCCRKSCYCFCRSFCCKNALAVVVIEEGRPCFFISLLWSPKASSSLFISSLYFWLFPSMHVGGVSVWLSPFLSDCNSICLLFGNQVLVVSMVYSAP